MDQKKVNQHSEFLIRTFEEEILKNSEKGITVSPIASELAAWYEKLRTAIENRDEEVILRAAIERIIKRRLLLGGDGKSVAMPLVRELVWARYFADGSIDEEKISEVEKTIDLYLKLRNEVLLKHKLSESEVTKWIFQMMSSDVENRLSSHVKKEALISYVYHILRPMVMIKDDSEEIRDVQVFIAIRKAYAKEDIAFLRYNLFNQYFGRLSEQKLDEAADRFSQAKKIIDEQLNYPGKFKIYEYIKRQIPPFLILEEIMRGNHGKFRELILETEELNKKITEACETKYANISAKVRRAIIRSIIFIFLSKVFLALTIEGTYERLIYGHVMWPIIGLNIFIPVTLMVIVSFFIKAPDKENTERITGRIHTLLFDPVPSLGRALAFNHRPRSKSALDTIFSIIWAGTFALSFGIIIYILSLLRFNIVSQAFFIFFFAIISFLSYRINQVAHLYTVKDRPSFLTPLIDFFFMPIARVGRYLSEGVAQINILTFILDLIIETPFKGLVAFFEQWFFFLHSKREDLA